MIGRSRTFVGRSRTIFDRAVFNRAVLNRAVFSRAVWHGRFLNIRSATFITFVIRIGEATECTCGIANINMADVDKAFELLFTR